MISNKEYWEVTLDKAKQNAITANLLYGKNLYGLSAYHAQQTVELAIKSVAYRLGFLKFLGKSQPLMDHNPSKIILPFVFEFLISEIQNSDKFNSNIEFKNGLDEVIQIFHTIKKTLLDSKKNEQLRETIWRASLKIPYQDEKISQLKKVLDNYSNRRLSIFLDNSMEFVREIIDDTFHLLKKTRHGEKIHYITKETEKTFEQHGFPRVLIQSMLVRNSQRWKQELAQFIQKTGEFEILDILLGPNGMLTSLKFSSLSTNIDGKWTTEDRLKIAWMTYVSTISPLALLIYPHEVYGRYPITRGDFCTEELYEKYKIELKNIIIQSTSICERIEKMLLWGSR